MRTKQNRGMEQEYYRLTEEQVLLIRELHFYQDDGSMLGYEGGPAVDSKRPFGNSNVEGDVLEIVDPRPYEEIWNEYDDEDEEASDEFYDKQKEVYDRLYPTLGKAMQVVVAAGSFEPGIYSCNRYCRNFERVTDENEIFKAELILGANYDDPRFR